jgi:hypothetical protein
MHVLVQVHACMCGMYIFVPASPSHPGLFSDTLSPRISTPSFSFTLYQALFRDNLSMSQVDRRQLLQMQARPSFSALSRIFNSLLPGNQALLLSSFTYVQRPASCKSPFHVKVCVTG